MCKGYGIREYPSKDKSPRRTFHGDLPRTVEVMPRLARSVRTHLEKARSACLSAVENYNKPGAAFRTRAYIMLMVVAWTSLFHAIFHQRRQKPWYRESGTGRGIRYKKIDGEPWHWDLGECLKRYYGDTNPPQRSNLQFILALRNKIEHRYHPELDPTLYGECQATLMNFEDLLTKEFGDAQAIADQLAVSLQFSTLRPEEQKKALHRLQTSQAEDLLAFIERFRASLAPRIFQSSAYSMRVFLLPKLTVREQNADLAVEWVAYDETKPEEMEELRKVNAIIKEKRVPIASEGLLRASDVVERLSECLPFRVTMYTHTRAWKAYGVRPATDAAEKSRTQPEFCVYDQLANTYGYKPAWVNFLCRKLKDEQEFARVTGKLPVFEAS